MKFTTKLLVLLLLISMTSISFGRRIRRKYHSHTGLIQPSESKYYQLVTGIVLGAANTTDDSAIAGIDVCLPQGWKVSFDAPALAKKLAASVEETAKKAIEAAKKGNEASGLASKDVKDAVAKFMEQTNSFNAYSNKVKATSELLAKVVDYDKSKITPEEEADGKNTAADKEGIKGEVEKKSDKGTFDKVLDVVEGVLNFACKFKDNVKKMFGEKYKRYYRRLVRRNFITKRKSKFLMSSAGFWDDVTGFFGKIGDFVKDSWNKVTDVAKWVYDKIKDNIAKGVEWAKGIINSPFVQKIINIVNCVQSNMGVINQLISTIKGIASRIAQLTTPVGIVSVFIDLMCNLSKFREAFTFLTAAKEEKNQLTSWRLYGNFVGKLLYAIGS